MSPLPSVTVLIPAFNEAARIRNVLAAVSGHPDVVEVLVVDDCSRDGTADVAETVPGVTVLRLAKNGGKTRALAAGLHAAKGDLVALIDADLEGLTPQDLSALIAPVRAGQASVSISLRKNGPRLWQWIGIDYISGERVLPKAMLIPVLDELEHLPKFGFEVHLNRMILAQKLPIRIVRWPGVTSPIKAKKYGLMAGIKGDAGMIVDMMRTVPPLELAGQIIGLRRLRV